MFRQILPSRGAPRRALRFSRLGCVALAGALTSLSCIERSNPFDPINSGPDKVFTVREKLQPDLNAMADREKAFPKKIAAFESTFVAESAKNAALSAANKVRKNDNARADSINEATESFNATAPVDSLKLKQVYSPLLLPLNAYGFADLEASQSELRLQMANIALFMSNANAKNAPATIYPAAFSDSVLAPFYRDTADFAALRARIDQGNADVEIYNRDLRTYNAILAEANVQVAEYNKTISFLKTIGNHPVISQADSLGAGAKVAEAGDTLLIGQGNFTVDLRFTHSGTPDKPILVRGYPGGKTVFQAPSGGTSAMILSGNANIQFQDIVFVGGVKLENASNNVFFQRCSFTGSPRFGLEVVDSHVDLVDCRITGNAIGAWFSFNGDNQTSMSLENVLIVRNSGDGLHLSNPKGSLRNSTISDNGGDGIELIVNRADFAISNTIISGNHDIGIYRQRNTEWPDHPKVEYCDIWGNLEGNWSLGGLDSIAIKAMQDLDFSVAPEFVNPDALGYGLLPGSEMSDWEHRTPPLKVGYRP